MRLLDYVEQGVSVDLANHEGHSLLMLASYNGHVELSRGLIAAGANVNQLNDRGQSPLAGVVFKKEDALIELLLAAGADPLAGQPSALDTARMFGRELQ
ncbi:ankyrin repeat domain-containing protein [Corynebacterium lizhenjunii]|uniref:Ankyrin repeat domain-containing protein n=2 Tax=Corynebacterium lizhenjunii TaxID=2709394 RepID=A0A7T0KHU5_9CORY|nr:ankyrin repeat domain-containing protein [Corynebacterium lizhenjunii]QPK80380.1 ankyrin repeat domain-containing protein [Corynebacterium lizhenjunii]